MKHTTLKNGTSLYYTDRYMEKMKEALAEHTHNFHTFERSVDARLDGIERTLKLASKNQDTIFLLLLFVCIVSLGMLGLFLFLR